MARARKPSLDATADGLLGPVAHGPPNQLDDPALRGALANSVLLGVVSGVRLHDNGCSLKVYRAGVVKSLRLRPGMHRYLPALASQLGGRVAEVEVNHRPRRHGRSKYGLSRTFGVLADLSRLRTLMQQAIDPRTDTSGLYEIAEMRETGLHS